MTSKVISVMTWTTAKEYKNLPGEEQVCEEDPSKTSQGVMI